MAPEVLRGKYDLPADVFSFGIVLTEMLTSEEAQVCCPTALLPCYPATLLTEMLTSEEAQVCCRRVGRQKAARVTAARRPQRPPDCSGQ